MLVKLIAPNGVEVNVAPGMVDRYVTLGYKPVEQPKPKKRTTKDKE